MGGHSLEGLARASGGFGIMHVLAIIPPTPHGGPLQDGAPELCIRSNPNAVRDASDPGREYALSLTKKGPMSIVYTASKA